MKRAHYECLKRVTTYTFEKHNQGHSTFANDLSCNHFIHTFILYDKVY
jgi:hypothetical protein